MRLRAKQAVFVYQLQVWVRFSITPLPLNKAAGGRCKVADSGRTVCPRDWRFVDVSSGRQEVHVTDLHALGMLNASEYLQFSRPWLKLVDHKSWIYLTKFVKIFNWTSKTAALPIINRNHCIWPSSSRNRSLLAPAGAGSCNSASCTLLMMNAKRQRNYVNRDRNNPQYYNQQCVLTNKTNLSASCNRTPALNT